MGGMFRSSLAIYIHALDPLEKLLHTDAADAHPHLRSPLFLSDIPAAKAFQNPSRRLPLSARPAPLTHHCIAFSCFFDQNFFHRPRAPTTSRRLQPRSLNRSDGRDATRGKGKTRSAVPQTTEAGSVSPTSFFFFPPWMHASRPLFHGPCFPEGADSVEYHSNSNLPPGSQHATGLDQAGETCSSMLSRRGPAQPAALWAIYVPCPLVVSGLKIAGTLFLKHKSPRSHSLSVRIA